MFRSLSLSFCVDFIFYNLFFNSSISYEYNIAWTTTTKYIGEECFCRDWHGCIMAQSIVGLENVQPYKFSECSKNDYVDALRAGNGFCLLNKPNEVRYYFFTCNLKINKIVKLKETLAVDRENDRQYSMNKLSENLIIFLCHYQVSHLLLNIFHSHFIVFYSVSSFFELIFENVITKKHSTMRS